MHDPQRKFTKVVVSMLGRQCREWPTGATNVEILTLVEEHSRPGVVVVFTDGSVLSLVGISVPESTEW